MKLLIQLLLLSTTILAYSPSIEFRSGRPNDEFAISLAMGREFMNPLGISHSNNLLIAQDVNEKRIGWCQIRSLGYATVPNIQPFRFDDNDNVLQRRDTTFNSEMIEQDVDEYMWQEFEDDPVDFPNGFASLPWSKEYRAASKAADDRLKRRQELLENEERRRPRLWELSSVYVLPEYRNQGIGTELVQRVLAKQQQLDSNQNTLDVYALTLTKTVPWYRQFGFTPVKDKNQIPSSMGFEVTAGNIVTKLMGEELVCIRTTLEYTNV